MSPDKRTFRERLAAADAVRGAMKVEDAVKANLRRRGLTPTEVLVAGEMVYETTLAMVRELRGER